METLERIIDDYLWELDFDIEFPKWLNRDYRSIQDLLDEIDKMGE